MKKNSSLIEKINLCQERIKNFLKGNQNRQLFTETTFEILQIIKILKKTERQTTELKQLLDIIPSILNRTMLQTSEVNVNELLSVLGKLKKAFHENTPDSFSDSQNKTALIKEDILNVFIEEARDLLENIQTVLKIWAKDFENLEAIQEIKRNLHTLKGSAKMVNQEKISKTAHELEQVLNLSGKEQTPLNKTVYDVVEQGQGYIYDLVESLNRKEVYQTKAQNIDSSSMVLNLPEMIRVSAKNLKEISNLQSLLYAGQIQTIEKLKRLRIGTTDLKMINLNMNQKLKNLSALLERTVFKGKTPEEMKNVSLYNVLMDVLELGSDMSEISKKNTSDLRALYDLLENQKRFSQTLNNFITQETMVSFSSFKPRLEMLIRKLSKQLEKKVSFNVFEEGGEIDRTILERLMPSLEHVVRNALDHGIEPKGVRLQKRKPEFGLIQVRFKRIGMEVIIEVEDDGQGINLDAIKKSAIEKGLISKNSKVSSTQIMDYIFAPDFSTAKEVTEISGRGIGLEIVRSEIEHLSGFIGVETRRDIGTKFSMRVPCTLSLSKMLIFEVQNQLFGLQLQSITSVGRISKEDFIEFAKGKKNFLELNNRKFMLFYMGELLKQKNSFQLTKLKYYPVILLKGFVANYAVIVDKISSYQEAAIKPLGLFLKDVQKCIGASILGDGSIVVILNIVFLMNQAKNIKVNILPIETKSATFTILVVDDSVTVRKITSKLLAQYGFEICIARNGLEALEKISEFTIDLILLDIEMPKMDGFELLQFIKQDPKYHTIPVVIMTSRTMEKHKKRANALGAEHFLAKPFQDQELVGLVKRLIKVKEKEN